MDHPSLNPKLDGRGNSFAIGAGDEKGGGVNMVAIRLSQGRTTDRTHDQPAPRDGGGPLCSIVL